VPRSLLLQLGGSASHLSATEAPFSGSVMSLKRTTAANGPQLLLSKCLLWVESRLSPAGVLSELEADIRPAQLMNCT
jgi:hypothetical protein